MRHLILADGRIIKASDLVADYLLTKKGAKELTLQPINTPILYADGTDPNQALKVSPYQVIAADVNQDGKVSSIDAFTILKMAVGRTDAPPPACVS